MANMGGIPNRICANDGNGSNSAWLQSLACVLALLLSALALQGSGGISRAMPVECRKPFLLLFG